MRRKRYRKNLVGVAVQRRRIELGWSQSRLAAQCQMIGWDISRGIVASLEGGTRWVGDFEAALLASALGVGVDALYPAKPNWNELGLTHVRARMLVKPSP